MGARTHSRDSNANRPELGFLPPLPDDEALANLLMSWYYSGYYTAMYVARQRR